MVTRVRPLDPEHADDPDWLSAGALGTGDGPEGTLAFNRFGDARLSLAIDHALTRADLDELTRIADLLPHLSLADLADPDAYRERHADAFDLPSALPRRRFNQFSELLVTVPSGGQPLPGRLGAFGLPVTAVHPRTLEPEPQLAPGPGRVERLAAAVGHGLARVEGGLVGLTRLDIDLLCALLLALAVASFVGAFTWQTWANHERFGTLGFDLGIYDQGTWLLSRLQAPFVTVDGISLFGHDAPLILLLVAPLYRLWADPRLLLLLQVLALAAPALAIFRLATTRLGHSGYGLAAAIAYLAFPAMQFAATWQFHPEVLAAPLLAFAVLAAEDERPRLMGALLTVAMLAKADVGLLVAAYGVFLGLRGRWQWGRWALAGGLGWAMFAGFVLLPIVNADGGSYLQKVYGIQGSNPLAVLVAAPALAGRIVLNAFGNDGLTYLALIFLPLALLPLLSWRWLIPVAPPLLLNLAATSSYQHSIRYHYLATSAPLLVMAAVAGLGVVAARRRVMAAPLALVLVVLALAIDVQVGPALWSSKPALGPPPAQTRARLEAMAMMPPDAGVSVQYNLVPHVDHRRLAYEFPNPFKASNWGLAGLEHDPSEAQAVGYVLLEPGVLSDDDQVVLADLRNDGDWRSAYERDGVLLLERVRATR